ncbi:M15 family metallopeptidase [Sutcliffiella horikoshii]|uniref:M15 family metallopeptidase n=1 Tax=Sutcliffiella horikoshii TaxID=79883 RepID=A0A5D4T547_9BACI|nr:M15 family metallopeptidase [Sutcliffiella horikoshii]TYS69264.1 M15 family metallopeptidase [Sutcliffiella horikoshii]
MLKKGIICGVSLSLLAGCTGFESLLDEKKVLVGNPHSGKSTVPVVTVVEDKVWEDFFEKEEDGGEVVVSPEESEEEPATEEEAEEPADEETPEEPSEPEAIPVVANPGAMNVMVNKFWSLPEGYRPADLIKPNVPFSFGDENSDRSKLRAEAAESLEVMFNVAKGEGIELYARSGFRSYETQEAIFKNEVATFGYEQAVLYVALPGTSEHQTGLAMDITAKSVGLELVEAFEGTAEGKWLAENAHHYGFILRYPKGKTNITGYAFEPWHFRYVGVDIAGEIYTKGLTFEEYMGDVREF